MSNRKVFKVNNYTPIKWVPGSWICILSNDLLL